eukprot:1194313-Prorocentrum_minimum.AAC.2
MRRTASGEVLLDGPSQTLLDVMEKEGENGKAPSDWRDLHLTFKTTPMPKMWSASYVVKIDKNLLHDAEVIES